MALFVDPDDKLRTYSIHSGRLGPNPVGWHKSTADGCNNMEQYFTAKDTKGMFDMTQYEI